MRSHSLIAASLCGILLLVTTAIAIPDFFTFQYRLLDSNGQPVPDGDYLITIRLFTDSIGGDLLFEETKSSTVTDGFAADIAGGDAPLAFNGMPVRPDSLWLEVQIDGELSPISPRTRLSPTPMASVAGSVRGDITTAPGEVDIDTGRGMLSLHASTADGDPTSFSQEADDGLGNSSGIQLKTFMPGNPVYGNITFERSIGGQTDTSYQVRSQDDGVITTHTWTQTGGPFKFSTQSGSLESGAGVTLSGDSDPGGSGGGGRVALYDLAVDDTTVYGRAEWAQGANDGPVYMLSLDSNGVMEKQTMKAAAERAFDAVISVGSEITSPPGDTIRSRMFTEIDRNDGLGPSPLYLLESGPSGSSMFLANAVGDTAASISNTGDLVLATSARIGQIEPLATLTVVGDICATGPIGGCSDARYKKEIATITDAVAKVMGMRGVTFTWRTEEFADHQFAKSQQVGVIAQELLKVAPEVVSQSPDGMYVVDYGKLSPILIEAIKSQQKTIEALQSRLTNLEALVTQLAKRESTAASSEYAAGRK